MTQSGHELMHCIDQNTAQSPPLFNAVTHSLRPSAAFSFCIATICLSQRCHCGGTNPFPISIKSHSGLAMTNIDFGKTTFSAPKRDKIFGTPDVSVEFLETFGADE